MPDFSFEAKEESDRKAPVLSIGVPIFNGEKTLVQMFESLLNQTFSDFEIIVSDNASTDKTAEIVKNYAQRDQRIRYEVQAENIGPQKNFKYVFDEACGRYFMWWSADDVRSPNFLYENVSFLEQHSDYVASASPNCFEDQDQSGAEVVRFELSGHEDNRIRDFFSNCWISHGIFYSVIRTDVLRACEVVGQSFLGADWAVNIFLASRGKIHRTKEGLTMFGAHGESNSGNAWKRYRTSAVSWVFPFYKVSLYTLELTSHRPFKVRMQHLKILLDLNARAAYNQLHAEFYPAYFRNIRPWINRFRGKKSCNS